MCQTFYLENIAILLLNTETYKNSYYFYFVIIKDVLLRCELSLKVISHIQKLWFCYIFVGSWVKVGNMRLCDKIEAPPFGKIIYILHA